MRAGPSMRLVFSPSLGTQRTQDIVVTGCTPSPERGILCSGQDCHDISVHGRRQLLIQRLRGPQGHGAGVARRRAAPR